MEDNNKNQKRLEYLIDEAFDNIDLGEFEEIKEEQEVEFSKQHNEKIKKILHKEQTRRRIKKYSHCLKKCAAILLIAFISICILTFSVEANRVKFLNYIAEFTDKYIQIDYTNENNTDVIKTESGSSVLEESIGNIKIQFNYIPSGFSLERNRKSNSSIFMLFENEDKNFVVTCHTDAGLVHLDTENAEVRNIVINGKECIFIEKNNSIRVYWTTSRLAFLVSGNLEESEIIEIIKNIK